MKQVIVMIASLILGIAIAGMVISDDGIYGSVNRLFQIEPRSRAYEVYDQ